MNSATPPVFPGGRTLGSWWRQLAGAHPEELWLGNLTWHSLDLPVEAVRTCSLPIIEAIVLKTIAASAESMATARLAHWLGLETAFLARVIERLYTQGLLKRAEVSGWAATEKGLQARNTGVFRQNVLERRVLHFLTGDWHETPECRFVPVKRADQMAWLAAPDAAFTGNALRLLQERVADRRPAGFPADIRGLLNPSEGSWERVAFATPKRCYAAVTRTVGSAGPVYLGWEVNVRSWEVNTVQPAFQFDDDGDGWFPPRLTEEAWHEAIVAWARARQLSEVEARQCRLNLLGYRLIIEVPDGWRARLRGETWLLGGHGNFRQAARVEFA